MKTSFTHTPSIDEFINEADLFDDFDRQSEDVDGEYAYGPLMTLDPLCEHESDPFEEARLEAERTHGEHIKALLLNFVDRNSSFSAEQICGPDAWTAFTDDEKYKAEYLIFELISKLNLPLIPRHDHPYPAPRRYAFM